MCISHSSPDIGYVNGIYNLLVVIFHCVGGGELPGANAKAMKALTVQFDERLPCGKAIVSVSVTGHQGP